MDINFPLVLVVLTFATGMIWLLDLLILRKRRPAFEGATEGAGTDSGTGESEPPKEPYLVELSKSFFPVLAIVLVLRSFLIEPFQIPSGSMLPTLEVGDFILVNKYAYGLRLPVAGTKVLEVDDPQRGDIMVFRFPEDGTTNYIKRVVGVPGDKIRYADHRLWVNGEEVETTVEASLPRMKVLQEILGDTEHLIMHTTSRRNPEAEGEWTIGEGEYFVMGDNRDNSNDSRFWGVVPDEMVVGKAFAIWMHWQSFTSLPSFDRVGGIE